MTKFDWLAGFRAAMLTRSMSTPGTDRKSARTDRGYVEMFTQHLSHNIGGNETGQQSNFVMKGTRPQDARVDARRRQHHRH